MYALGFLAAFSGPLSLGFVAYGLCGVVDHLFFDGVVGTKQRITTYEIFLTHILAWRVAGTGTGQGLHHLAEFVAAAVVHVQPPKRADVGHGCYVVGMWFGHWATFSDEFTGSHAYPPVTPACAELAVPISLKV